jgi:glycosyltransferase involved in cell wall biosynthesis
MKKITAIIPTGNEIQNIEGVIESVRFADEIIVIDSYSNDGTAEKAKELGVTVLQREFDYHAAQKNWAIPKAANEWIILVDADMGERVNFSGWRNDSVIRLFKRDQCLYEEKKIHEEIIANGKVGKLKRKLYHNTYVTFDKYIEKMNRYATLQAKDYDEKTGRITPYHLIIKPFWGFFKHYIVQSGFRDGIIGLTIGYVQGYVIFMRYIKLWLLRRNRE